MLLKPDCIPCILKMIISYVRKLSDDEEGCRQLLTRFLAIPALRGQNWDLTSPEAIEPVMDMLMETFGVSDPFSGVKEEENARALELYPFFKQSVLQAEDPLFSAVNLAIMGNRVDIMVLDRLDDLKEVIAQNPLHPVSKEAFETFRQKLAQSPHLLYLGDNSGEIVFDRLLIETITDLYHPRITFAVRNLPALNDVTLAEAGRVGMDRVAGVVSNGMDGCVCGTVLSRCSEQFRQLFAHCDLVISKGGGNFETLENQTRHCRNITFMLLAKCAPYCNYFKTGMFEPVLMNFFQ